MLLTIDYYNFFINNIKIILTLLKLRVHTEFFPELYQLLLNININIWLNNNHFLRAVLVIIFKSDLNL